MKPTKEAYLRAADYMARVGNNATRTSWGSPGEPCCLAGALRFSAGKELFGYDFYSVIDPLKRYFLSRGQNYHQFSAENSVEVCTAKLREIAETLPSEIRTTDISILKDIAASVSAGNVVEIVG